MARSKFLRADADEVVIGRVEERVCPARLEFGLVAANATVDNSRSGQTHRRWSIAIPRNLLIFVLSMPERSTSLPHGKRYLSDCEKGQLWREGKAWLR
jgi:hypothetical protein